MKAASYLSKSRNGVYYARFVIPRQMRDQNASIGRELRVSTLTKDPRHGVARARALKVLVEDLAQSEGVFSRESLTTLLQANMTRYKTAKPAFSVAYDEQGRPVPINIVAGQELAAAKFMQAMGQVQTPAIATPAPKVIEPENTNPDINKTISELIGEFIIREQQRANAGQIGRKNVPALTAKLEIFKEYCGDKKAKDLTAEFVLDYKKDIAFYPIRRHVLGILPDLGIHELIKKTKTGKVLDKAGNKIACLSVDTVSSYMVSVANFLKFCEKKHIVNPLIRTFIWDAAEKSTAEVGTKREIFTDKELAKIFGHDYLTDGCYNRSYQFWVPLIAAFTGARLNEICQLTPKDIIEHEHNKWLFSFNDEESDSGEKKSIKNKGSIRVVPVHKQLIECGFIQYVKKQIAAGKETKNLFDVNAAKADGYGKVPGDWFNTKYLKNIVEIKSDAKVFHSFRHTFITKLHQSIIDASGTPNLNQDIENYPQATVLRRMVGHSSVSPFTVRMGKNDTHTNTYMGDISYDSMSKLLHQLNYSKVLFVPYQDVDGKARRHYKKRDTITGADLGELL
jgi:integrase